MIRLYHNPKCSKSRATKQILQDKNLDFVEVEYLKNPPKRQELEDILKQLDIQPSGLIRSGESIFKELSLQHASEEELLTAMLDNPILIERPIVITNKGAKIGRPPENILEIV